MAAPAVANDATARAPWPSVELDVVRQKQWCALRHVAVLAHEAHGSAECQRRLLGQLSGCQQDLEQVRTELAARDSQLTAALAQHAELERQLEVARGEQVYCQACQNLTCSGQLSSNRQLSQRAAIGSKSRRPWTGEEMLRLAERAVGMEQRMETLRVRNRQLEIQLQRLQEDGKHRQEEFEVKLLRQSRQLGSLEGVLGGAAVVDALSCGCGSEWSNADHDENYVTSGQLSCSRKQSREPLQTIFSIRQFTSISSSAKTKSASFGKNEGRLANDLVSPARHYSNLHAASPSCTASPPVTPLTNRSPKPLRRWGSRQDVWDSPACIGAGLAGQAVAS